MENIDADVHALISNFRKAKYHQNKDWDNLEKGIKTLMKVNTQQNVNKVLVDITNNINKIGSKY